MDHLDSQRRHRLPFLLLLNSFNKIWISGELRCDLRKAMISPISKPGKDPTNPTNYRPIALTSCICKTIE